MAPPHSTSSSGDSRDAARARSGPALVIAGGSPIPAATVADLAAPGLVVAVDSGLDRARELGWGVDLVVGDLDSVQPDSLARARAEGVPVQAYPTVKDETDLELALRAVVERDVRSVVVVGLAGDRFDHVLANALLLASPAWAGIDIEGRFGVATVRVVRAETSIAGRPGDLVSLLPVHGPALGVCTQGLLYPLVDEDLGAGSPRGVSNELTAALATVSVRAGTLLAISPETTAQKNPG